MYSQNPKYEMYSHFKIFSPSSLREGGPRDGRHAVLCKWSPRDYYEVKSYKTILQSQQSSNKMFKSYERWS